MSWHFSRALVEAYSAESCLAGARSAPSSSTTMHGMCWSPGKTTKQSNRSRYGMTYEPLTDDRGAELLMWYLAGFPAKTSTLRDVVQASPASEADSGPKWRELSVRYDPATSSWKTHQCLFQEDLPESSVTLPKWGMMRDGVLSERTTLALPTSGTESGLWPTPTTQDNPQIKGKDKRGTTLGGAVRMWPTPTVACATGGQTSRGGNRKNELLLAGAAKAHFPTPRAASKSGGGIGLDGGSGARKAMVERFGEEEAKALGGGQLNPPWVEWLMGWPIGWTDLKPLETDRFRQWQHSHGKY